MKFLECTTKAEAMQRSHDIAVANGSGKPGQVTQYWHGWNEAEDGTAILLVGDEKYLTLSESERLLSDMPEKFKPKADDLP